jgi:lysyl-tRNA synthetase class I
MTIDLLTVRLSEKEKTIEALTKMNQLADKQIMVAIKQSINEALNWWDDVDAGKKGVEKREVEQECLGEDIIKQPADGTRAAETNEKLTTQKEQIISTLKNLNTQVSNYFNNENEPYQKEVDGVYQIRQGSIECGSLPSASGQSCD